MRGAVIQSVSDKAEPWLVVFDLDGTLIDSSLDLCLAINATLAHVERPSLPHDAITSCIGDGAAMLVRRALALSDTGASSAHGSTREALFQKAFPFFLTYYREHKLDNTRLYEGVLPALEVIRAKLPRLPMAVLTNKPERPSREICEGLGIARFFFANYGGNSFPSKKPDPAGLISLIEEARQLLTRYGLGSSQDSLGGVTLVGDSATDVFTARRAGVRSIGCTYGLSPESLLQTQPDSYCNHPEEWPGLLGLQ